MFSKLRSAGLALMLWLVFQFLTPPAVIYAQATKQVKTGQPTQINLDVTPR